MPEAMPPFKSWFFYEGIATRNLTVHVQCNTEIHLCSGCRAVANKHSWLEPKLEVKRARSLHKNVPAEERPIYGPSTADPSGGTGEQTKGHQ